MEQFKRLQHMKLASLGHVKEFKVVGCRGKAFGMVLACLHPSSQSLGNVRTHRQCWEALLPEGVGFGCWQSCL